jgi:hypothetical protein
MNDKDELYRIQMQLEQSQLAAFVSGMRNLHEEMTEMFLGYSESGDFVEANAVIDRVRKMG